MKIILFDTPARTRLSPLTLTRAIADIRMGILTVKERWEKLTGFTVHILTAGYLQPLYSDIDAGEYVLIDATVLPTLNLLNTVKALTMNMSLWDENGLIAGRTIIPKSLVVEELENLFTMKRLITTVERISWPHQLFQWNDRFLKLDYDLIINNRVSIVPEKGVRLLNPGKIYIEEGADIGISILNASTGPIYIGKNATVMDGCCIRGPFAIGEGAVLKSGAKVYGATTIGPFCAAGGEIKNSILTGFSNKAHDGYLGDSVIGEWCNLGAGTTNSNVKNTAGIVKQWNYYLQDFQVVGNKCGMIMGDYSRTAINASINTGSVIGVSCNVFGNDLSPKVVLDFSWGEKGEKYDFDKALAAINNWKNMKNKSLDKVETAILKHIFDLQ